MENILKGNPLIQEKAQGDYKVKRRYFCVHYLKNKFTLQIIFYFRWDDDVVFKNCAKGEEERLKGKGYINDTLRSEFHKKFMDKYVK